MTQSVDRDTIITKSGMRIDRATKASIIKWTDFGANYFLFPVFVGTMVALCSIYDLTRKHSPILNVSLQNKREFQRLGVEAVQRRLEASMWSDQELREARTWLERH